MNAVASRRMAGALLLALLAGPALAHKSSDAYVTLQVQGDTVTQRIDVALRDIDRELALDANEDGILNWGEVRRRWTDIQALVAQSLQVHADGQACVAQGAAAPQLDTHTDGRYAVMRRRCTALCAVRSLTLDYRLFATSDADHRGILRIDVGDDTRSAVLVPGTGALAFDVATSSARSFAGFVVEGMHHIAIGADHVLFLVTLLMVAVWQREDGVWVPRRAARSAWREALGLVTAFTVAHSITLALAAGGVLAPPTRWVETLIALSVLVAALDNLRPMLPGPRWPVVALFGVVHGFGFAGPLQDLGLRRGELALPLLGFNLGVEMGQLALVALLLPLAVAFRGRRVYRIAVVGGGSAVVAVLALAWTLQRAFDLPPDRSALAPASTTSRNAYQSLAGPAGAVTAALNLKEPTP